MVDSDARYGIGDLAALGGVSRRTVRYYVHEGLLPSPTGVGRGDHYGPEHLAALLRVKALQEAGRTLDEIRAMTRRGPSADVFTAAQATPRMVPRSRAPLWRRVPVAHGVELHVEESRPRPSPSALRELADWCRRHLGDGRPPTRSEE
ncbi:MAG TPA: MerR family transcriptional regulator [Luteitalea sp.]|nr:MerR family transcriptional regulator [Luteitalea sp.]